MANLRVSSIILPSMFCMTLYVSEEAAADAEESETVLDVRKLAVPGEEPTAEARDVQGEELETRNVAEVGEAQETDRTTREDAKLAKEPFACDEPLANAEGAAEPLGGAGTKRAIGFGHEQSADGALVNSRHAQAEAAWTGRVVSRSL